MSQVFTQENRVPVTWVKLGPCIVTQIKNPNKDGYWAVQLGVGERKIKNITKSLRGHLLKGATDKNKAPYFLREVHFDSEPKNSKDEVLKIGDNIIFSDIFSLEDIVSVTGISKGKGFAGVVKRHHFKGGPRTHGQSDRERAPGSIGQTTTPGRVFKGKRMAGRMGSDRVTQKNLKIVGINSEKGEIAISSPIPGSINSLVIVKKTGSSLKGGNK